MVIARFNSSDTIDTIGATVNGDITRRARGGSHKAGTMRSTRKAVHVDAQVAAYDATIYNAAKDSADAVYAEERAGRDANKAVDDNLYSEAADCTTAHQGDVGWIHS